MAYEDIFELIEVYTHFQHGKAIPLRFLWNTRVYKVKTVQSQWSEKIGSGRQIHYSVLTNDSNCFELIFNTEDLSWEVARVYLEG